MHYEMYWNVIQSSLVYIIYVGFSWFLSVCSELWLIRFARAFASCCCIRTIFINVLGVFCSFLHVFAFAGDHILASFCIAFPVNVTITTTIPNHANAHLDWYHYNILQSVTHFAYQLPAWSGPFFLPCTDFGGFLMFLVLAPWLATTKSPHDVPCIIRSTIEFKRLIKYRVLICFALLAYLELVQGSSLFLLRQESVDSRLD